MRSIEATAKIVVKEWREIEWPPGHFITYPFDSVAEVQLPPDESIALGEHDIRLIWKQHTTCVLLNDLDEEYSIGISEGAVSVTEHGTFTHPMPGGTQPGEFEVTVEFDWWPANRAKRKKIN